MSYKVIVSDGPNMKTIADEGWNEWFASLPKDDWGDSFDNWIPIRWDEERAEWIREDVKEKEANR